MKFFASLLSSLLLVACGGGGSGGGSGAGAPAAPAPVAATATFALKQAYANEFRDTALYSLTISGAVTISTAAPPSSVSGTLSGSGSITQVAVTSTTFDGVAAQSRSKTPSGTLVVTVNGAPTSQALPSVPTTQFVNSSFDLLGFTSPAVVVSGVSVPASFSAAAGPMVIPETAKVGDTGTVGVLNSYASAAKGAILGTTTITYALEADTATTAFFRLTQTSRNGAGVVTSTQVDSFRVTPTGAITRLKQESQVTISSNGTTLSQSQVFTY